MDKEERKRKGTYERKSWSVAYKAIICILAYKDMLFFFCRGGKYSEDDAKAVMTQILNVVAFCHLQGVVHRDLKPEVEYIFIISLPLENYIDICWSSPSNWNKLLQ